MACLVTVSLDGTEGHRRYQPAPNGWLPMPEVKGFNLVVEPMRYTEGNWAWCVRIAHAVEPGLVAKYWGDADERHTVGVNNSGELVITFDFPPHVPLDWGLFIDNFPPELFADAPGNPKVHLRTWRHIPASMGG